MDDKTIRSDSGESSLPHEGAAVPVNLGGYEIVRMLGQGGMGTVYLAKQPGLNRMVAIKLLPLEAGPEEVERFKREARAAARLRHKGIVAVHEVGEDRARHFIVMEYLAGGSLHDLLKKSGPLPPRRAAEIMRKIADALNFAHRQGVTHRDLKPQNIMLDEHGEPLIGDFGLARVTGEVSLSVSGQMFGTPAYMAPEAARGEVHTLGPRSDVWSAGACLYQMLSGALPFEGSSVIDTFLSITTREPRPLRSRLHDVPRDLEAIVFKCLTKEQELRYRNAGEFTEDLDRFLDGRPVKARPLTSIRRAASWVRRNRAISFFAAAGPLAVALTLAYTLWAGPAIKAAAHRSRLARFETRAVELSVEREKSLAGSLAAEKPDPDGVVKEAKQAPAQIRAALAPADDDERAAVERGIETGWKPGPLLSRAHFIKKEWPSAYRYDPTGPWGLEAQIEIAKRFREDLRLAEAAQILGRIRSRFPGTKPAEKALAALGDVLAEQGDLEQALAAYRESGARPDRVEILDALLGEKQSIPISGGIQDVPYAPQAYEPMPLLRLDAPTIVLPVRDGRPAFQITKDGLVPVPSPLAVLPPTDKIVDACDADLDGDGKREVIAALTRPGAGCGFAVIGRSGGEWKLLAPPDLSNPAYPLRVAAGDIDGDGRDEAFVIFMWQTLDQWKVRWRNGPIVEKFNPGGMRPWVLAAGIADVDGDGHNEVIFGRSGQCEATVQFFESRSGKLRMVDEHPVGEADVLSVLGDGRLAIASRVFRDYETAELLKEFGQLEDDTFALTVLSRKGGEIRQLARRTLSKGLPGNVAAGKLAGKPAILYATSRGAIDLIGKKVEGQRLNIIVGDPSSDPVSFGLPWPVRAFRMIDHGDGDSELVALLGDRIAIMGRLQGPPPKLKPVDPEPAPPNEAAVLMRAANDLLESDSYDAARDLLGDIAERFPGRAEAVEALRLRCDALLRAAERDFKLTEAKMTPGSAEAFGLEKRAVEACRTAAAEARRNAASFPDRPEVRRRFLLLAAESARRALDFKAYRDDLDAAANCAPAADDKALLKRISELDRMLSMNKVVEGDPAADDLPFVTNAPSRVRRVKGGVELILDSHSERFVAGLPIIYYGGAVSIDLDLELKTSVWSAGAQIGLIPRGALEGPLWGSAHLWLHGTTAWDKQGATFSTWRGGSVHFNYYRGRWRISWSYLPEADMQTLEIRDRAGEVVFRGRAPADRLPATQTNPMQLLLGVSIGYDGGDALVSHEMHPAYTQLTISNVSLRTAQALIDRESPAIVRDLELQAGGRLFRGDRSGAAALYRQAIERDGRLIRARVYLAMAANDPASLGDAFRVDPYETVCAVDDAIRGVGAEQRLAMGAVIRRLLVSSTGITRAGCWSFMGEYAAAADELAKLPVTPARQYLLRRNLVGSNDELNAAWEWLTSRNMRTAGAELPPIAWAPGQSDTPERLRQEIGRASTALGIWLAASRYLLLVPDDVQVLTMRANASLAYRRQGPAEHDCLTIAELLPNDSEAQLQMAGLYASRHATRETLDFLRKAVAAGLRDAAALDAPQFQFLKDNAEFKVLRDGLKRGE